MVTELQVTACRIIAFHKIKRRGVAGKKTKKNKKTESRPDNAGKS